MRGPAQAECRWRIPKGGGFVQFILHHPAKTQAEFDRLARALKREPFAGLGDAPYVYRASVPPSTLLVGSRERSVRALARYGS